MRGRNGLIREAGFFSRRGQLFSGGPAEGWLQKIGYAPRLIALIMLVGGVSLCQSGVALAVYSIGLLIFGVFAFLNIPSILLVVAVPVAVLLLPSWTLAVVFYDVGWNAFLTGMLRSASAVLTGTLFLHSLGLRGIGLAFQRLGLPPELCLAWRMMIAQASGFKDLTAQMAMARNARYIHAAEGGIIRRQIGGQMAFLLARMLRQGEQTGMAMEAREITQGAALSSPAAERRTEGNAVANSCFLAILGLLTLGMAWL